MALFRNLILLCIVTLANIQLWKARPTENDGDVVVSVKLAESTEESTQTAELKSTTTTDPDHPIRSLSYYGGAKGKYLLIHPSGRTTVTNKSPSYYGLKAEEEDEEDVGMEEGDTDDPDSSSNSNTTATSSEDGISVGTPPDSASVAEAKPVGLAIAGPGGVAASRPVGTAVVGPGGLALAKPVATAVAGIPGAEAALVGIHGNAGGGKKKTRPLKNIPSGSSNTTTTITTTASSVANATVKSIESDDDINYNEEPLERSNDNDHLEDTVISKHHSTIMESRKSASVFMPLYLPQALN